MSIRVKAIRPMVIILAVISALSCMPGSPVRTQKPMRDGEVELRIENNNWSTARVYMVSGGGGHPIRVATVSSVRTQVKRVRTHSNYYVFMVTLIGDSKIWVGFTEWGPTERCLTVTIQNFLQHTTAWPCRLDKPLRGEP